MRRMTKVDRYRCEWCGKEFRTPDRHRCKWDADAHNCLSCKHRGEYVAGESATFDPFTLGVVDEGKAARFKCPYYDGGGGNDFDCGATSPNGNGCEHWQLVEGYRGKRSFVEIKTKRNLEGGAK